MLSVIIPVLNEAKNLESILSRLRATCPAAEVVVVDGGSEDEISTIVRRFPWVMYLSGRRGRARQMNAGASVAKGEILLFLHADVRLSARAEATIIEAFSDHDIVAGRFDIRFDNPRPVFKVIAFFINFRSRLTKICTGDQALFVRRKTFEELGGYPDIPLMEDVELARRLKRRGGMICLRSKVTASARKWEREGVFRTILLMWALRFLYFIGVNPSRLHRWYYGRPPSSDVKLSASNVRSN